MYEGLKKISWAYLLSLSRFNHSFQKPSLKKKIESNEITLDPNILLLSSVHTFSLTACPYRWLTVFSPAAGLNTHNLDETYPRLSLGMHQIWDCTWSLTSERYMKMHCGMKSRGNHMGWKTCYQEMDRAFLKTCLAVSSCELQGVKSEFIHF